jgi:hypothetical protein
MRLKLDKLFLSAGLALAVIATTIPVGASVVTKTESGNTTVTAVTGLSKIDESGDHIAAGGAAISAIISGVSAADTEDVAVSGLTGVTKRDAVASDFSVGTLNATVTPNEHIKALDSSYDFEDGAELETVTITQKRTYTISGYHFNYQGEDEIADTEADELAVTEIVKALGLDASKSVEVESDYGTASIATTPDTTNGNAEVVTSTAVAGTTDTSKYAAGTEFIITGATIVATTSYVVNKLPSGYTYDYVIPITDSSISVVLAESDGDRVENLVSLTKVDNGYVYSTDVFGNTYYIGTKTVSAAGKLVFAQTSGDDTNQTATVTSGNYTATIKNATTENAELKAQVAESDKYVSTFSISVALTNTGAAVDSTTSPLTFKIAVPQDLPAVAEGYTRTYKVIRAHDNNGTIEYTTLDTTFDGTYIIFESEVFSQFALVYSDVAADTTEEETNNETNNETESATEAGTETTTTTADSSTTSTTASKKTGDNSMMPLFMTTLLLALCAGSLAIYKEKKTN